jgi:hypothetical protein
MPYAECNQCGDDFWREDDEWWKKLCFDCWKESKSTDDPKPNSEISRLRKENDDLRDENYQLRQYKEDFAKLFKYIGFLIFACHPDRVPGREQIAHEVMVWLNAKREQFRG